MKSVFKWIAILLGVVFAVLVLFMLYARFVIGVNTPIGEGELDREKLGNQIQLPDGFSIGLYATDVPNARVLRFTRSGDLLVANPSLDKIMILGRDMDGDNKSDGKTLLLDGLNGPNGMDFFEDWLYVAETDAIGRVKFDHDSGAVVGAYERIVTGLPGGENHWKKTLRFGPDGLMYVSMGSSCNVCIEEDPRRAAMIRYKPDGTGEEIFARGMRNSAGFDWSPTDGHIYATDNGRDLLGNDFPPCELNKIEQGKHYGWPYANGNKIPDPDFGEGQEEVIANSIAPVYGFRAHNAPLGMEFVRGDTFPEEYRGAAIVALHGSWNRTEKDGYKVVSLHWDADGKVTEKDFITGFLKDDKVIGRPSEVTEGPDGAFYIADDYVGVIYRMAYGEDSDLDITKLMEDDSAGRLTAPAEVVKFSAENSLGGYTEKQRQRLHDQGQLLFRQNGCISCHNPNGSGLKVLEKIGEKYDVATLSGYFLKPKAPMPIFRMSDSEREALSVFVIENY